MSIRGKLGRRAGALSIVGALALAGATVGATSAEAATHTGSWHLEAGSYAVMNTSSITTNSSGKVSSCVSITKLGGAGAEMSFELMTGNHVIWHSGDHEGLGRTCSPIKKPGKNKKVYDHIIVFNQGSGGAVQLWGKYTLNNY